MSDAQKSALKNLAINAAIGFALYKFTSNAMLKAAGAGVLGVAVVGAARSVTNI